MAVAMRERVKRPRRRLAGRRGHDLALRGGHRPGLRDTGADRVRGPVRLRRHRQRHQPRGPAVRRGASLAGASDPTGAGRRGRLAVTEQVGDLTLRGFSRPVRRALRARPGRGPGDAVSTTCADRRADAAPTLADLDEAERYLRFDRLAARHGRQSGRAMHLNLEGESVVVLPSVTIDRVEDRSGALDPGLRGARSCSCCCCSASRGSAWSTSRRCRSTRASSTTTSTCCPASSRATPGRGCTGRRSATRRRGRSRAKLLERPRLLRAHRRAR